MFFPLQIDLPKSRNKQKLKLRLFRWVIRIIKLPFRVWRPQLSVGLYSSTQPNQTQQITDATQPDALPAELVDSWPNQTPENKFWTHYRRSEKNFQQRVKVKQLKFYRVTWCVDFHKRHMQFLTSAPILGGQMNPWLDLPEPLTHHRLNQRVNPTHGQLSLYQPSRS